MFWQTFGLLKAIEQSEQSTPDDPKKKRSPLGWLKSLFTLKAASVVLIAWFLIVYWQLKVQRCVFDYTHLPDELIKTGITENYTVNTINNMITRIVNWESNLRSMQTDVAEPKGGGTKKAGDPNQNTELSRHEFADFNNMKLADVPVRSLVYLLDRVMRIFGVDSYNYVSLEFSSRKSELQLSVQFKGKRETFLATKNDLNPDEAVLALCYQAALFILQEDEPIHAAEYFFDIGQPTEAIQACLLVLQGESSSEDKSHALTLLGFASYHYNLDPQFRERVKEAYLLDRRNFVAGLYSGNIKFELPALQKMAVNDPLNLSIWYQLLDRAASLPVYPRFNEEVWTSEQYRQSVEQADSSFAIQFKDSLRHAENFFRRYGPPNQVPSVAYWYLGKKIEQLARAKGYHNYLDTAIRYFQEALEVEHKSSQLSTVKMAEYYNALAFSYQQKAFLTDSLSLAGCFEKALSPSLEFIDYLETSAYYARTAINHDSLNLWAWSTLGEYYGIRYQMGESAELKALAWQAWQRSRELGLNLRDYQNTSEPYCFFARKFPEEYEKVASAPAFFSGPLRGPRLLRILRPDPPPAAL